MFKATVMVFKCFYIFICIVSSNVCLCQRRISNGRIVASDKKYMVYLLNSPYSYNQPDSWLCGGVLISTTEVLTAAACLSDVSHIYVIAGYRNYVNAKRIVSDECVRSRKNKIIRIIIPKAYNPEIWIKYDIGLGIVEKPYDFSDLSYRSICSYEPADVTINFDIQFEEASSHAIALGWGGAAARHPGSVDDINSEYLMEAETVITNISLCQKHFSKTVDFYFLCTYNVVNNDFQNIDSKAEVFVPMEFPDECMGRSGLNNTKCPDDSEIFSRRKSNRSDPSLDGISDQNKKLNESILDKNHTISRRQGTEENNIAGICQNDHGGPLVALAGTSDIVIGVAINSVYNYDYKCVGPFLYLSTARSSVLIKCLLAKTNDARKVCESMNVNIKEYNVTWPKYNVGRKGMTDETYGVF